MMMCLWTLGTVDQQAVHQTWQAQMASLRLMLAAVRGRQDEAAMEMKAAVNNQLEACKRQTTATKAVQAQIDIKKAVIERQRKQVNEAVEASKIAQDKAAQLIC